MKKIRDIILDIIAIIFVFLFIFICFKVDYILGVCSVIIIGLIALLDTYTEHERKKEWKKYENWK